MEKPFEDIVYPSLAKKLNKKSLDDAEITLSDTILTLDTFREEFQPFYNSIIVRREEYNKDIDVIYKRLEDGIAIEKYRYLSAYHHDTFLGGTIYFCSDDIVFYAHRVYDRDAAQLLSLPISIDFYMERELYKRKREEGYMHISHGLDSHPRTHGIGLSLFKLKSGVLPMVSKKSRLLSIDVGSISLCTGEVFLFHNSDSNGRFKNATYMHKKDFVYNQNLIHELGVICAWAGIEYEVLAV